MISIFKLDGEESKAIFALEFNETPYLFLYFNQEWVNETDPEVKALKEEYSKAMDLNDLKAAKRMLFTLLKAFNPGVIKMLQEGNR